MTTVAMSNARVAFAPTRLGHANLFVSDLERSIAFYSDVAGIELVRREPAIHGGFHSNGNTHHDVGMLQVAPGVRRGIGGFQQVSSHRGTQPGLNHLGWEVRSEADLISALRRASGAGVTLANCSNHQITHSAYVVDPGGYYHEFYADIVARWRDLFNLDREELVTERWDWERDAPGRGPMPADPKDRRRVDSAIFHPRRITHATLVTSRFEEALTFFTDIAGLASTRAKGVAKLNGTGSAFDLLLLSDEHGLRAGLAGISFVVEDEAGLGRSLGAAKAAGIQVLATFELPHKKSVLVKDPDGLVVEFYAVRSQEEAPLPLPRPEDPYWAFAA